MISDDAKASNIINNVNNNYKKAKNIMRVKKVAKTQKAKNRDFKIKKCFRIIIIYFMNIFITI